MYRRLRSGLPKDPVYPSNLEGLGYYINEKDEIRNIKNPKAYFKFFLTRNDRYNALQREAMNESVRNIVSDRLIALNLDKIRLPLGATEDEPNVPIFISSNLSSHKRIVVLFYENNQDLGIFAHRILGGNGGINVGSAVNFVKHIQSLNTKDGGEAPGIVLANLGQLRWWRRGKKACTQVSWFALPQRSVTDPPYIFHHVKNTIPGNRSTAEHVDYIFNHVIKELANANVKLDIIGVSEGAVRVAEFLNDEASFAIWGSRAEAFAAVATYFHAGEITNSAFGEWFKNRGRVYLQSDEPNGTLLAPPSGTKRIPAHGAPIFSLGQPYYSEIQLPYGYKTIIDWFQEVAYDEQYENPTFERFEFDDGTDEEPHWSNKDDMLHDEPLVSGERAEEVDVE